MKTIIKIEEKGAYCFYAATYAGVYDIITFYGKNGLIPVATLVDINEPNDLEQLYIRKELK